jgi:hypothetical protein
MDHRNRDTEMHKVTKWYSSVSYRLISFVDDGHVKNEPRIHRVLLVPPKQRTIPDRIVVFLLLCWEEDGVRTGPENRIE